MSKNSLLAALLVALATATVAGDGSASAGGLGAAVGAALRSHSVNLGPGHAASATSAYAAAASEALASAPTGALDPSVAAPASYAPDGELARQIQGERPPRARRRREKGTVDPGKPRSVFSKLEVVGSPAIKAKDEVDLSAYNASFPKQMKPLSGPGPLDPRPTDGSWWPWRPRSAERGVYMTLATHKEFVVPALVIGYSLLRANTSHVLVCMVTEKITTEDRARLALVYDRVALVDQLRYDGKPDLQSESWAKLCAYLFVEYPKVLFLDADIVVTGSIDELFDCTPPCAAIDMGVWQTTVHGPSINSGVYLLRPSRATYEALAAHAPGWRHEKDEITVLPWRVEDRAHWGAAGGELVYTGPYDQALVNRLFEQQLTVLPYYYNFLTYIAAPELQVNRDWLLEEPELIKVVHFATYKPWVQRPNDGLQVWFSWWWELFLEMPRI